MYHDFLPTDDAKLSTPNQTFQTLFLFSTVIGWKLNY